MLAIVSNITVNKLLQISCQVHDLNCWILWQLQLQLFSEPFSQFSKKSCVHSHQQCSKFPFLYILAKTCYLTVSSGVITFHPEMKSDHPIVSVFTDKDMVPQGGKKKRVHSRSHISMFIFCPEETRKASSFSEYLHKPVLEVREGGRILFIGPILVAAVHHAEEPAFNTQDWSLDSSIDSAFGKSLASRTMSGLHC